MLIFVDLPFQTGLPTLQFFTAAFSSLSDRVLTLQGKANSQRLRGPASTSLYIRCNFLPCCGLVSAPEFESVRFFRVLFCCYLMIQLPDEPRQLPGDCDNDFVPMQLSRSKASEPIVQSILSPPCNAPDLPALPGLPGR